jgi:hypothetical protein
VGSIARTPAGGLCNPGPPLPDRPQCGSNYGSEIDLWAPAEFIRAATNPDTDLSLPQSQGVLSGTSFAAPHVSDAIAYTTTATVTVTVTP